MIDTHAHLQDEKFESVDELILGARGKGIGKIVCASADIESSKRAVEIAWKYSEVYSTVGIHPHDAKTFNEETLNELRKLAKSERVVAIGEIGLDYYYNFSSKEEQKKAFIGQIELAYELKLPIVIHSREATGDMLEIIRGNLDKLKYGVCIHCFNMSPAILREINGYGFYISLGGIVTFKNANNVLDVARLCDSDKLMLETDCPYLAPEPYRYKLNKPEYVVYVAEKIASLRNMSVKDLEKMTDENACKFFNIKD